LLSPAQAFARCCAASSRCRSCSACRTGLHSRNQSLPCTPRGGTLDCRCHVLPRFGLICASVRASATRSSGMLHRRGMPVEIVQEFNLWRAVRLFDGTNGWIHGALLSGHRTFIVDGATCSLWERATSDASQVARLEPGVIGRILTCMKDSYWCKVSVGGYRGYLSRSEFWGTFKGEAVSGW
jgi:SH3-like domain-containing protein